MCTTPRALDIISGPGCGNLAAAGTIPFLLAPGGVHAVLPTAGGTVTDSCEGVSTEFVDHEFRLPFVGIAPEVMGNQFDNLAVVLPDDSRASIKDELGHVVDVPSLERGGLEEQPHSESRRSVHQKAAVSRLDLPRNIPFSLNRILRRVDLAALGHSKPWPLLREGFAFESAMDANTGLSNLLWPCQYIESRNHVISIPQSYIEANL